MLSQEFRVSVAPMIDWTDRNCRGFHRLMSKSTWLYTEMITAPAIIHGDAARLLDYDAAEHPVVLQLGGSDPQELASATRIANAWGYDEVNLNLGCPSDRVQSGCFGAVLMLDPQRVVDCVTAMRDAAPAGVDVTVKCRIGVDEQIPEDILPDFVARLASAGIRRIIIHARKAWLKGLSPRENREIPPLDYALVHNIKNMFPQLSIEINGGINSLAGAAEHAALDGAMIGRAAYHQPFGILGLADAAKGLPAPFSTPQEVALAMRPRIALHLSEGGRLHQMTRHMLGLFHGRGGARLWKRTLSEAGPAGDMADYDAALRAVDA